MQSIIKTKKAESQDEAIPVVHNMHSTVIFKALSSFLTLSSSSAHNTVYSLHREELCTLPFVQDPIAD